MRLGLLVFSALLSFSVSADMFVLSAYRVNPAEKTGDPVIDERLTILQMQFKTTKQHGSGLHRALKAAPVVVAPRGETLGEIRIEIITELDLLCGKQERPELSLSMMAPHSASVELRLSKGKYQIYVQSVLQGVLDTSEPDPRKGFVWSPTLEEDLRKSELVLPKKFFVFQAGTVLQGFEKDSQIPCSVEIVKIDKNGFETKNQFAKRTLETKDAFVTLKAKQTAGFFEYAEFLECRNDVITVTQYVNSRSSDQSFRASSDGWKFSLADGPSRDSAPEKASYELQTSQEGQLRTCVLNSVL